MKLMLPIAIALSATPAMVRAQDCPAEAVEAVSDACEEKDHTGIGTDAVARCSATIEAPEGYFILGNDVSIYFGSTYEGLKDRTRPSGKQTVEYVALSGDLGVPNSPLIDNLDILSSVTANAYCDRSAGSRLGKTCYAIAEVTAKSYPLSCLRSWLTL